MDTFDITQYKYDSYILPSDNDEMRNHIKKFKIKMMEHIITTIYYALKNNLSFVEVFQFENSKFVIMLSEKEFESNVNNILTTYMASEMYELCPRVVKLQELLKRNIDEKKNKKPIARTNRTKVKK